MRKAEDFCYDWLFKGISGNVTNNWHYYNILPTNFVKCLADVLGIFFFKTLFISEKKSENLLSGILSENNFYPKRPVHSKDFCDSQIDFSLLTINAAGT